MRRVLPYSGREKKTWPRWGSPGAKPAGILMAELTTLAENLEETISGLRLQRANLHLQIGDQGSRMFRGNI